MLELIERILNGERPKDVCASSEWSHQKVLHKMRRAARHHLYWPTAPRDVKLSALRKHKDVLLERMKADAKMTAIWSREMWRLINSPVFEMRAMPEQTGNTTIIRRWLPQITATSPNA